MEKFLQTAATIISRVFDVYNASLLVVLIIFLVTYPFDSSALPWTIFFIFVLVIIPVLGDLYLVEHHKVVDWDLSSRKERVKYIHLDAVLMMMLFLITLSLHAPQTFLATSLILFLLELVYAWITIAWKISIHAQSVGLVCSYILVFLGPVCAWILMAIPLIFFARLYLKKHSFAQLVAGIVLTMTICLFVLKFFNFY